VFLSRLSADEVDEIDSAVVHPASGFPLFFFILREFLFGAPEFSCPGARFPF